MSDVEVFISYASEDRVVAESIARELTELGVPTFFDRFSMQAGDSILESVQRGLASAKFGVVIVSPDSLEKDWPREELRQLLRGRIEGRTRILPVWHNVAEDQVQTHQPLLSDIWAVSTSEGLRAVVRAIAGQVVSAPTVAVVPLYQRPVHRFLNGDGELTLGVEGPAFTLFEALVHFSPEGFPLYVEGEVLDREDLLLRAAQALAGGAHSVRVGDETRERIAEMCRSEIGLDPRELE
jgi:hypothetical protein